MILHLLAATLMLGNRAGNNPPPDVVLTPRVRKIALTRRSAQEIYGEFAGSSIPGIKFFSYDPTDNTLVAQGTEAGLDQIAERIAVEDNQFETTWVLTARKPFVDLAFAEFKGPGLADPGTDSYTIEPTGSFTVQFPVDKPSAGFEVILYGTADKDLDLQIDSGNGAGETIHLKPDERRQVVVRMIVPDAKRDGVLRATCTVVRGKLIVKRALVERARS